MDGPYPRICSTSSGSQHGQQHHQPPSGNGSALQSPRWTYLGPPPPMFGGHVPAGRGLSPNELASSSRASHGFMSGIRNRLRQSAQHDYSHAGPSSASGSGSGGRGGHYSRHPHRRDRAGGPSHREGEVRPRTDDRGQASGSGDTAGGTSLARAPEVQGALALMRLIADEDDEPSPPPLAVTRPQPRAAPNIATSGPGPANAGGGPSNSVSTPYRRPRHTGPASSMNGGSRYASGGWNGNGNHYNNGGGATNSAPHHGKQREAALYPLERVPNHAVNVQSREDMGPPSFHGPGPSFVAEGNGNSNTNFHPLTTSSGSGSDPDSGGPITPDDSPLSESAIRDIVYSDVGTQTDAPPAAPEAPPSPPPEVQMDQVSGFARSAGTALSLDETSSNGTTRVVELSSPTPTSAPTATTATPRHPLAIVRALGRLRGKLRSGISLRSTSSTTPPTDSGPASSPPSYISLAAASDEAQAGSQIDAEEGRQHEEMDTSSAAAAAPVPARARARARPPSPAPPAMLGHQGGPGDEWLMIEAGRGLADHVLMQLPPGGYGSVASVAFVGRLREAWGNPSGSSGYCLDGYYGFDDSSSDGDSGDDDSDFYDYLDDIPPQDDDLEDGDSPGDATGHGDDATGNDSPPNGDGDNATGNDSPPSTYKGDGQAEGEENVDADVSAMADSAHAPAQLDGADESSAAEANVNIDADAPATATAESTCAMAQMDGAADEPPAEVNVNADADAEFEADADANVNAAATEVAIDAAAEFVTDSAYETASEADDSPAEANVDADADANVNGATVASTDATTDADAGAPVKAKNNGWLPLPTEEDFAELDALEEARDFAAAPTTSVAPLVVCGSPVASASASESEAASAALYADLDTVERLYSSGSGDGDWEDYDDGDDAGDVLCAPLNIVGHDGASDNENDDAGLPASDHPYFGDGVVGRGTTPHSYYAGYYSDYNGIYLEGSNIREPFTTALATIWEEPELEANCA